MKFSRQKGIHHNQETSLAYLKELEGKNGILLAMFSHTKEKNIGTISATFDSGYIKFGFLVFPQHSGKGLLSELLSKWIQIIEGKTSVKKFYIGTNRNNLAMRAVAERAGFIEVQPDSIKGKFTFDSSIEIVHYLRENSC
jgi:RimJ/RimL family protein N-acetyltransferase